MYFTNVKNVDYWYLTNNVFSYFFLDLLND